MSVNLAEIQEDEATALVEMGNFLVVYPVGHEDSHELMNSACPCGATVHFCGYDAEGDLITFRKQMILHGR